jgi:hypothetical protein
MVTETYQPNTFDYDAQGRRIDEMSPSAIPGMKETTNFRPHYSNSPGKPKTKRTIAKFFSEMSRFGMRYEDQVIDNMRAIPADKSLLPKEFQLTNQDLFTMAASNWKVKSNKDQDFFSKTFPQKREALRNLACQPELEDILDTMTNESIVYDEDYTYFCEPFIEIQELQDLKPKVRKQLKDDLSRSFRTFYKMLNWKYRAWDDYKRWLIEGELAWEIVWDSLEKPKRIIGLVPIDAATLTKKFDNNKWYWVQFKGMSGKERKLLDSQVIYIAYQETNAITRQSYLERLIRPFNIYRIIEQAQLIWTITNASYKMRFTIPVKGMNRATGMQTLNMAMNQYKEDIKFQADTGELSINGQTNLPFNKEYWLPENDSGSPQIETLGGEGPDLADNDQLKYFKNQLYKISKIPLSRFDQESGETWFGSDATSVARVEIDFARFVTRMRNIFAQVMIKPLQLQLAVMHPELLEQKEILESVSLQFKSYNVFEELMNIELMSKRVQHITEMKEALVDMDAEGNDVKFFASKFLVEKYLKLSPQDLALNEKYKQEELDDLHLAGGDDSYDMSNESLESMIANLAEDEKLAIKAHIARKKKKKKKNSEEE